jgi:hypothetical protein
VDVQDIVDSMGLAPGLTVSQKVAVGKMLWPRPTNAQVVAVLQAVGYPGLSASDFPLFQGGTGVVPRLLLRAFGWTPTVSLDKLKDPSNTTWWQTRFDDPATFWATLAMQAKLSEAWITAEGLDMSRGGAFDLDIANAKPAALAQEGVNQAYNAWEDIQAEGTADCPPFLLAPGGLPVPNPKCMTKELCAKYPELCKGPIRKVPGLLTFPWWAWVALLYAVSRRKER